MNATHPARSTSMRLLAPTRSWWTRLHRERLLRTCGRRLPKALAASQDIPAAIKARWLASPEPAGGAAHTGWHPDSACWELSALALAHFFELCQQQQPPGLPLALPSWAADSVWHLWLASDPAGLAGWQRRWFGREVPHLEARELGAPLPPSLARTFVAACRSEGRSSLWGPLPLLFALDGRVAAPGGWHYLRGPNGVFHRDISPVSRRPSEIRRHPELAPAALAGLGLLTAAELHAWRSRRDGDGGGGVVVAGGGDTAAADGCTSGSSCGGCSCGGGCGGS